MKFVLSELDIIFANELPALDRFNIKRPDELGRYARHVVELIEDYIQPYRVVAINLREHHRNAISGIPLEKIWEALSQKKPESVAKEGSFGFFEGAGGWKNDAEIVVDFSWFLVGRMEDGSFTDHKIDVHRFHLAVERKDKKHYRAALDGGWEMVLPGEAPAGVHRFLLASMRDGLFAYGSGGRRRDIICESTGLLNRLLPGFDNLWLSTADASRLFPRVEKWIIKPFIGFGYLLPGRHTVEVSLRCGAFFQPEKGTDFYITNRSKLRLTISYANGREKESHLILKSLPGLHPNERLNREIGCDVPAPKINHFGRAHLAISFENPNGDKAGLKDNIYVANPDSTPAVTWQGTPEAGQDGNDIRLTSVNVPLLYAAESGARLMYLEDAAKIPDFSHKKLFLCTDKGPRPLVAPRFESLSVDPAGGWAPELTFPKSVAGPVLPPRQEPSQLLTPPLMYNYIHNGVRYTVGQRFWYRENRGE